MRVYHYQVVSAVARLHATTTLVEHRKLNQKAQLQQPDRTSRLSRPTGQYAGHIADVEVYELNSWAVKREKAADSSHCCASVYCTAHQAISSSVMCEISALDVDKTTSPSLLIALLYAF